MELSQVVNKQVLMSFEFPQIWKENLEDYNYTYNNTDKHIVGSNYW